MRYDTRYPSILDALGIMNTCFPKAEGRTRLFETEHGFRITVHDPYSSGGGIHALDIERSDGRIAFCIPCDEECEQHRVESVTLMKSIAKIVGGTLFDKDSLYLDKRVTEPDTDAYAGEYRTELLKSLASRHLSSYASRVTEGVADGVDMGYTIGEAAQSYIDVPPLAQSRKASRDI